MLHVKMLGQKVPPSGKETSQRVWSIHELQLSAFRELTKNSAVCLRFTSDQRIQLSVFNYSWKASVLWAWLVCVCLKPVRSHWIWILIWLLGFTSGSSAAGSPGVWGATGRALGPTGRHLRLIRGLLLTGSARETGAVHDVSVQHLQQQVVQRHHVFHLHAVKVVHAFVTAHWKDRCMNLQTINITRSTLRDITHFLGFYVILQQTNRLMLSGRKIMAIKIWELRGASEFSQSESIVPRTNFQVNWAETYT